MGGLSFTIRSLGCKVSQYDGDILDGRLRDSGLSRAIDGEIPDLLILNGCAVTARASQKAAQILRAARRNWPKTRLILFGCEARYREMQHIVNSDVDEVWNGIPDNETIEKTIACISGKELSLDEKPERKFRTRAFLKIQDGCNHFCTYCIIPFLRGREHSKELEKATNEAENLAKEGYKEITLTGIHLGRYEYGLHNLLGCLEQIEGIRRIRISSIEPCEVGDELISWLQNSKKACPYLHLPLQSGCDKILKLMNRPYSTKDFARISAKIRKCIPNIAIGTDVMVGFPGETDEDFRESAEFIKQMEFSRIHIFRYSSREGTAAATFPGKISGSVKRERAIILEEIRRESAARYNNRFLNRTTEVLWETCDNGVWKGLSREYVTCLIKDRGLERMNNTISEVTVTKCFQDHLLVVYNG